LFSTGIEPGKLNPVVTVCDDKHKMTIEIGNQIKIRIKQFPE